MNRNKYFLSHLMMVNKLIFQRVMLRNLNLCILFFRNKLKIGVLFENLDSLITLHQRKFYKNIEKDFKMQRRHKLFVDYYEN